MVRGFVGLIAAAIMATGLAASPASAATAVRKSFGALADGTAIEAVELSNAAGVTSRIITYGATLQALRMPDKAGKIDDITLGYDGVQQYVDQPNYLGVTVGRYANRISGATFTLDGKTYQLAKNNGPNALHGGLRGFDKQVWTIADVRSDAAAASVTLTRVSPDGEEGYPGALSVSVTYTLTETNDLSIRYVASTTKPTIINLTNHALFNLAGVSSHRSAMDATLSIEADAYTPVGPTLIPTGEIRAVDQTPFDFRKPVELWRRIRDSRDPQIAIGRGIDHNFKLRGGTTATPKLAATLVDRQSGRGMRILTTEPGLQVYTGNFLDGTVAGHGGVLMRQGDGIALETQRFPDAPNQPALGSVRLDPGQTYSQLTIHRLFVSR